MTEPWLVLKFGGTSVSGKQQWETIASLASQRVDDGNRVLLHSQHSKESLKILHRVLIEDGIDSAHKAGVFGPGWQEIQN